MFGGNNAQLGATSTPAKPGGMFSSFSGATSTPGFGNAATSAAPAFGGTSAFGTTSFGAPAQTSAAPTLGGFGGFGAAATSNTTTAPTLGGFGGFGSSATTSAPNSLFGQAAQAQGNRPQNTFGGFGGFGAATTNQQAPTFGQPAASTGGGFGGFGAATSTTTAPPTFSGFGQPQQQQQQQQQQTTGFGGFGTGGSNFGSMFPKLGQTSTVTPGFGGFGNTNFMMGQPQQQAPQISPDEAFAQSIYNVCIYSDERDTIIAKWNFLQASWGSGKAFYSQNANPFELSPQNYLSRFKAIGYSRLPGKDNKVGLVALNFNKTLNELKTQQQQILTALNNIFGNKPNFVISIESNKDLDDKRSQLVIYVEEKLQMSLQTKRIPATDVANYLNQANVKPQLNNMGVYEVLALVLPDEDQLKEYLEKPPKGINAHLWNQAQLDNPNPRLFIPVPLVGFSDLKNRIKCQESEVDMHALYMEKLDSDIALLRKRHANATSKIMEHKRLLANVTHRLLKIVVKQECTRKLGLALTPEEEVLRTKLENMQAVVSAPTQFKGRLSELLSQMRMQRNQYALTNGADYTLDKDSEDEMKTFLTMQQKAIEVLIDTVTNDMKAINIILQGLPSLIRT